MTNLKKEFKKIMWGFLFVAAICILFHYLRPPLWASWLILMVFPTAFMLWKKQFVYKTFVKNAIYIICLLVFFKFMALFGSWGFFIGVMILVGAILIKKRKKYIQAMEAVESKIWGAPLSHFKRQGKKPPKLKFSLR